MTTDDNSTIALTATTHDESTCKLSYHLVDAKTLRPEIHLRPGEGSRLILIFRAENQVELRPFESVDSSNHHFKIAFNPYVLPHDSKLEAISPEWDVKGEARGTGPLQNLYLGYVGAKPFTVDTNTPYTTSFRYTFPAQTAATVKKVTLGLSVGTKITGVAGCVDQPPKVNPRLVASGGQQVTENTGPAVRPGDVLEEELAQRLSQAMRLRREGDLSGAEELYRESLEALRSSSGPEHPAVGAVLANLAALWQHQGDLKRAEYAFRQALEILTAALPRDHWRIAEARSLLGGCFTALGRFSRAEALAVRGYEGLAAAHGARDARTLAALDRVIELYVAWDRPAQAEKYRARAAD